MAVEEKISLTEQCRRIIEKLERVESLHAREIEKEIAQIQRDVARLRDRLIERLRNAQIISAAGRREAGLDTVNMALSLIVAVEYPVTSIQRSALKQARDILKPLTARDFSLDAAPASSPKE